MSIRRRRSLLAGLFSLSCCAVLPLQAASSHGFDPARPPAPATGPEAVGVDPARVTQLQIHGRDGRLYQLWVAALGQAPRSGYPVMFLLDGHAAMATLTSTQATRPLAGPVLLVAVGSPGPAYFDVDARAYDYTPPSSDGKPIFDPRVPGRRAGGAEAFLATLRGPVTRAVAGRWPLDPHHRGIWGHSYGGLFALYVLFRHGNAFDFYAPTSPSLWWHAPLPRQLAAAYDSQRPGADACIRLSNGSAEGHPAPTGGGDRAGAAEAPPPFGDGELVHMLAPVFGTRLHWQVYPGLSHGETLPASLGPAIRSFAAWSAGAATCGYEHIKR